MKINVFGYQVEDQTFYIEESFQNLADVVDGLEDITCNIGEFTCTCKQFL